MRLRSFLLVAGLALTSSCRARGCESEKSIEPEKPSKRRARKGFDVDLCLLGVRALTEYGARCEEALPWWGTIDRAVEQLRGACEAMVRAPGVRYERDEIEACADAIRKMPCGAKQPELCRIGGTLPKGASCVFGAQCARGLFCRTKTGESCGTCIPYALEGEACGEGCDENLVCIADRCRSHRGEGESCTGLFECKKMLRCVADPKGATGNVCVPFAKEGEKCGMYDCSPAFRCDSGVCKPRSPPKSPGSPCVDPFDCVDFTCVAGTCRAYGGEGDACPDQEHAERAPCGPSFSCLAGVCKPIDANACP